MLQDGFEFILLVLGNLLRREPNRFQFIFYLFRAKKVQNDFHQFRIMIQKYSILIVSDKRLIPSSTEHVRKLGIIWSNGTESTTQRCDDLTSDIDFDDIVAIVGR